MSDEKSTKNRKNNSFKEALSLEATASNNDTFCIYFLFPEVHF